MIIAQGKGLCQLSSNSCNKIMMMMVLIMMMRRRIKIIAQEKGPCQLSSSCYNGAKKLLQVRSHTAELF